MEPKYLSVEQFATLHAISVTTVRRRLDDGTLRSIQLGGKGHKHLIPRDALLASPSSPSALTGNKSDEGPPESAAPRRRGPRAPWKKLVDP